MIIRLDWKICFGICFLIIFMFYALNLTGLQKYIHKETVEEKPKERKKVVIDEDEEERKRKEQIRSRRLEKEREEEWKRRHFYQRQYEFEQKRRPIEREVDVNGLHNPKNKEKPITRWSKPDKSRGEQICAQVLSNIFDKEFAQCRLKEIINPETGQPLEIDVYNEELKIGLEYNGPQHYEYPNFTNNTYKEFTKQLSRDEEKRKQCAELGIRLIEVPYIIKEHEIHDYIIDSLFKLGIRIEYEN